MGILFDIQYKTKQESESEMQLVSGAAVKNFEENRCNISNIFCQSWRIYTILYHL